MAKRKRSGKRSRKSSRSAGRPRLTLCMIVRNEEASLGRCLDSVKAVVDEIVVVDTGSEDRTLEVAKAYGAKTKQIQWEKDFAAARNVSLELATGDWVLLLDADEVIPASELDRLRAAVDSPFADAYRMTTRNYQPHPTGMGVKAVKGEYPEEEGLKFWVPTTKIRLFRRVEGVHFVGAVHELVEQSIEALGMSVADLTVPVLHFGDVAKKRDPDRYLEVARRKVAESPEDPKGYFELATVLNKLRRYEEAVDVLTKGLEVIEAGHTAPYVQTELFYAARGNALQGLGRYEEAILDYRRALGLSPRAHEFWNNIGVCYESLGKFDKAAEYYERAHKLAPALPLPKSNLERVRKKLSGDIRLSVCMIVKDAEQTLERAIRSVLPFADEVVVVDTGSSDRSVEIATRLGAKVGHFAWRDDFAAARNASLEMATGKWILWVDADDVVPATEWPKLQELKFEEPDKAFMFILRNEGAAGEKCWQLRMFPNRSGVKFVFPVHEQVTPSLQELGIPITTANVEIVHTGYSSEEVVREKKEKYLRYLLRYLETHPEDQLARYHVAFTYHTTGRQRQAVEEFRRITSDRQFEAQNPRVYANALLYLGRAYLELGETEQAISALQEARSRGFEKGLVAVSLAQAYNLRKEPEKALQALEEFPFEEPEISPMPVDLDAMRYSAYYQKGLALEALERIPEALEAYAEAQRTTDRYDLAQRRMAILRRRLRASTDWGMALEELARSGAATAEDMYELGNRQVHERKIEEAENSYRAALEQDPEHVGARLALAALLRRSGRTREAIELLVAGVKKSSRPEVAAALVDALFAEGQWEAILALPVDENTWAARFAARLFSNAEGEPWLELGPVAAELRSRCQGREIEVADIWEVGRNLPGTARFHLAAACAHLDPSIREAVETAAEWAQRGYLDKAAEVVEKALGVSESSPETLQWISALLERLQKGPQVDVTGAPTLETGSVETVDVLSSEAGISQ
ncbi:MAG: glycosyltransferase [Calditrichaeota bacterium]|nr:glycosyltransferase [Calditrichota bacterium]